MVNLHTNYLYAKGTVNVVVRDIDTGDVEYQSDKVQSNRFSTTCDMGPVQAGLGNATAINIPHNAAVNLELTSADFSMAARAMQVGSQLAYNGIGPVCEVIEASSTTLTVTKTPAAPYGYSKNICNIVEAGAVDALGTAYTINGSTKAVKGFAAEVGHTYVVNYFAQEASNQYFNIGSVLSPGIKHVTVQVAVYSAAGTSNAMQGNHKGDLYFIIPRMQFAAKADTDASQTAASTTDLSGTALTYDEAAALGVCSDYAISGLAQVLYVPAGGATTDVEGLVIVGGVITMPVSSTKQIPVEYKMKDGRLVQPDYTDLTYAIPTVGQNYATVSSSGLLTSTASAGETEVTVSLESPAVSVVANVVVTE